MGMLPENKYQVTPDGLVFTVQDDGTIRKLAKISPNGDVEPFGAAKIMQKEAVSTQEKKSSGFFTVFFIILLIAGLIFAGSLIVQYEGRVSYLNSRLNSLEYENRDLLEVWANEYPIVIKDIQVRNQGESYNQTIYSSNTTFLEPKITYKSLKSGTIKLDIKLWTPSGNQSKGASSEGAYSYSQNVYVYKGEGTIELSGWGNKNKGHWSAGRYGYEIWCNGHMLKDKVFYIK